MKKIVTILTVIIIGVLGVSAQTPKPIGINKAKVIALRQTKGKITSSKTIKDGSKIAYLIDIKSETGNLTKLKIDSTGNVLDNTAVATNKVEKNKKKKHWWSF